MAWVKEDDPSQGLRYLYLEDADYQRLLTQGSAVSLKSVNAQVGSLGSWHGEPCLKQPPWRHGCGMPDLRWEPDLRPQFQVEGAWS